MTDPERLSNEFEKDMESILDREREIGMQSTRFQQMIHQYGGVKAARLLLKPDRELPPNTFSYLREIERLDLTMEFYAVQKKYRPLFTVDERAVAQWRLEHGD